MYVTKRLRILIPLIVVLIFNFVYVQASEVNSPLTNKIEEKLFVDEHKMNEDTNDSNLFKDKKAINEYNEIYLFDNQKYIDVNKEDTKDNNYMFIIINVMLTVFLVLVVYLLTSNYYKHRQGYKIDTNNN